MNKSKTLTVYNASAGSGKTYTLALKYIALALKGEAFDNEETGRTEYRFSKNDYTHILAVTFTNKATAEMKGRILKYLFALANPSFREADDLGFLQKIMVETCLTEAEVQRRSAETLEAIMQDYDHFKVETIDSFFQTLLTSMAHEMNLPRGFKVDLDDKALVADAVNNFLIKLKGDSKGRSAMKRVISLLNDYIEQKNKWDISKELTKFAQENLFKDLMMNKEEVLTAYMNGDAAQLYELRTRLRNKIKEIDTELKQRCNEIKKLIGRIAAKPQYQEDKTLKISPIVTYIERVLNHTLFPVEKGNTSAPALIKKMTDASLLKDLVDELLYAPFKKKNKNYTDNDLLSLIEQTFELSELCSKYQVVYSTCLLTLQKLSTLSLLSDISQEVKRLTAERGTHLLANTPQLFGRMVKAEDASFIYERLGTTLRHILIDEFQDTSHAQWQNFKLLISEMLSQGQQCMLVGDVKQSIYRWRGGDWGILGNIDTEEGIGRYVDRLPKMVNYRSQPLIVRFNNAFFMKAASYCDCNSSTHTEGEVEWTVPQNWQEAIYEGDLKNKFAEGESEDTLVEQRCTTTEAQGVDKSTTQHVIPMKRIYQDVVQIANKGGNEVGKPNGYVFIKLLDNDYEEQALKELSQKIDLVKKECQIEYKDMLILVRKNREAKKVVDYMQDKRPDLPLTTEEAFMYSASNMVNCLVNILKFINDMDALKAEIDNALTEEDKANAIKKYDEGADYQLSLFRLQQCYDNLTETAQKKGDDTTDYAAVLSKFMDKLKDEQWRTECHHIPLYELLQIFMRDLAFDELNNRGLLGQATYLHSFMDEVVAFADEKTSDIAKFVAYWEESLATKSIATNASDAISVMTIHKAKGLEKHTVFIPFGNMDLESDKAGMLPATLTCDVTEITRHNAEAKELLGELPVIPITMGKEMDNSFYHDCYAYDHLQQRVDNLNTLYVAFTRAGTNLFVWSQDKKKGTQTTSALLKAFVSNEEAKIDEEDQKPYYEFGKLEPLTQAAPKTDEAKQELKANVNPFDDNVKPEDVEIALQPSHLQNVQFVQSAEAKEYMGLLPEKDAKKEVARQRGKFYHDLLSRIDTLDDLPRALNDLVTEGIITESEKAKHETYVRKCITSNPMYNKWFDGSYQLYNECDIFLLASNGTMKVRRPDRVMINDHEVIIVDYKTAKDHEGYESQVSEYRDLLHKMTGLPATAYLWYLETGKCHSV